MSETSPGPDPVGAIGNQGTGDSASGRRIGAGKCRRAHGNSRERSSSLRTGRNGPELSMYVSRLGEP